MQILASTRHSTIAKQTITTKTMIYMGSSHQDTFIKVQFASIHKIQTIYAQLLTNLSILQIK